MDKILYLLKDDTIELNLTTFEKMKSSIVERYPDVLTLDTGLTSSTLKPFVETLDKYLLHTIEECFEYRYEVMHGDSFEEQMEELTDIIHYMVSIMYILNKNIISKDNEMGKFLLYEIDQLNIQYFKEYDFYPIVTNRLIDDTLLKVMNYLISMRRKFPERKWHYKSNREFTQIEMNELMFSLSNELREYIVLLIKLLISSFINGKYEDVKLIEVIELVNNLLIGKHKKVMNKIE